MAGWKYGSFTMAYPYYRGDASYRIGQYIENTKITLIGITDQLLKMGVGA